MSNNENNSSQPNESKPSEASKPKTDAPTPVNKTPPEPKEECTPWRRDGADGDSPNKSYG